MTRETLLLAYDQELINDEEFVLLYNLNTRGRSRTAATFWKQCWKPLTIITKSSTLDVASVLDPPLNTSKHFDYPYWNYNRFDLNDWSDEECRSNLKFCKADENQTFRSVKYT